MTHVSSCVTWHRTHELSHLVSLFPSNYLVWEGIQDLLEYMVLLTKTEVLGDWSWRPQGKGQNGLWSEWEEQGSRDYPHLSLLHSRSWKKNFFLGIILTKSSCIFGADTTPRVHSLTRKCRLDFSSHFLRQITLYREQPVQLYMAALAEDCTLLHVRLLRTVTKLVIWEVCVGVSWDFLEEVGFELKL